MVSNVVMIMSKQKMIALNSNHRLQIINSYAFNFSILFQSLEDLFIPIPLLEMGLTSELPEGLTSLLKTIQSEVLRLTRM